MSSVRRILLVAAGAITWTLAGGCASAPVPSLRPVARDLLPFLPSPARIAATGAAYWLELHGRLVAGESASAIETAARQHADSLASGASNLLVAESRLVAGDASGALAAIDGLGEWEAELVAGKAAETLDDRIEAARHYSLAASSSETARERLKALRAPAATALAQSIGEALATGLTQAAARWLEQLVELEPERMRTLALQQRVAAALGDPIAELRVVDRLVELQPEQVEWRLRRAELALETGDSAGGLAALQQLASRHPGDARIERLLARARFLFRLSNIPQEVRQVASRPLLSRADCARLLYWLVPEVRAVRGSTPPVATDLVDHPAREEILRVASLRLLQVDETLHLFEPERPARRAELFSALLARPGIGGPPPCARGGVSAGDVCMAAASCGLIRETSECLPSGPVGGREAVDWIQMANEAIEGGP